MPNWMIKAIGGVMVSVPAILAGGWFVYLLGWGYGLLTLLGILVATAIVTVCFNVGMELLSD